MAKPVGEQVVVITGASAGIGRACVRAFAAKGAKLGLVARNVEGLEGARREAEALGAEVLVCPTDVADAHAVEQAAAAIEQRFGRIDTWVNDAMVTVFAPISEMTAEEYKRVTDVTYLGYVYGTMAALKRMRPRNSGTIIQVGSALAYRSIPLQSAYCGAKAAIRGFTDSLRTELIHEGSRIEVSHLILPAVNTPQFDVQRTKLDKQPQPVPPIYTPELIANVVVRAAERPRREIVIAGSALKAVVGQKLVPAFVDWYLARTGFKAQQTDQPVDPNRPDNLYSPVPGDHGAHGRFTDRSRTFSPQLWANLHRKAIAAGTAATAVAAFVALRVARG